MNLQKLLLVTKKPFYIVARDEFIRVMQAREIKVVPVEGYSSEEELIQAVRENDPDAIFARSDKINERVMSAAPHLRYVIRGGSGFETIDMAYARQRNIHVDTTPGTNSTSVAELAFDMVSHFLRGLDNPSARFYGEELEGKVLAIDGLGRIGIKAARIGHGYGMKLRGHDKEPSTASLEAAARYGVAVVGSKEALYDGTDIVSLHFPLDKQTRGKVDFDLISRISPTGMLINTARPALVNNADLVRIMGSPGWEEFRYGLDAEQEDPIELQAHLKREGLEFGNRVYATPKIGAQTKEASFNTVRAAIAKILAFSDRDAKVSPAPAVFYVPEAGAYATAHIRGST